MILSLLIHSMLDVPAHITPTRGYRILAWTIDIVMLLAAFYLVINLAIYWVTEIVPAINYANGY